jgi:hypothetical protein
MNFSKRSFPNKTITLYFGDSLLLDFCLVYNYFIVAWIFVSFIFLQNPCYVYLLSFICNCSERSRYALDCCNNNCRLLKLC